MNAPFLNLLPEGLQEAFVFRKRTRIALRLFLASLFLLAIVDTLLVNTILFLRFSLESEQTLLKSEELRGKQEKSTSLAERIREAKSVAQAAEKILESKKLLVAPTLAHLETFLPERAYVKELQFDPVSGKISLTGFAPLREDVFEVESRLKKDSRVSDLDFPYTNFLTPKNVTFRTSFTIANVDRTQ